MFFNSSFEFIAVVLFLIAQLLIRRYSKNYKLSKELLLAGNLALISTLVSPLTIFIQLGIALFVFIVSKKVVHSAKHGKQVVTISILVLIVLFVLRNYPKPFGFETFNPTSSELTFISRLGISYILFRHIRYLVNIFKGKTKPGNLIEYCNFILFFPNFLAGPIDTFKNYQHWREKESIIQKKALIFPGLGRITIGFIKKYLFVPLIYTYAVNHTELTFIDSPQLAILLSLCIYSVYIYLDFSGYSDIAIGTGYIMGIRTPENFDNPYLSLNIADFWRRWHITFSDFLRDLIFIPLVKWINKLNLKLPRLGVSGIGYILTFAICGIWHGDTVNFLYWGLWHGVGLFIFKIWTTTSWFAKLNNNFKKKRKSIYEITSALITFVFVTMGWMFFHYTEKDLTPIINTLIG